MNYLVKSLIMTLITAGSFNYAVAQEIVRKLDRFDQLIVSPKINVVLEKGTEEKIRIVYENVYPEKINMDVSGKALRVYLDDAQITEKMERINPYRKRSMYADASITAYVTYRYLRYIEIRGEQELTCNDTLEAEKLKLVAYGQNDINLSYVKADFLKATLYGTNKLKIEGGEADYQKYNLYGENVVDASALKSNNAATNIYGESKLKLSTKDELKINSFGEGEVSYDGDAMVSKGIVLGEARIQKDE